MKRRCNLALFFSAQEDDESPEKPSHYKDGDGGNDNDALVSTSLLLLVCACHDYESLLLGDRPFILILTME